MYVDQVQMGERFSVLDMFDGAVGTMHISSHGLMETVLVQW